MTDILRKLFGKGHSLNEQDISGLSAFDCFSILFCISSEHEENVICHSSLKRNAIREKMKCLGTFGLEDTWCYIS